MPRDGRTLPQQGSRHGFLDKNAKWGRKSGFWGIAFITLTKRKGFAVTTITVQMSKLSLESFPTGISGILRSFYLQNGASDSGVTHSVDFGGRENR